MSMLSVFLLGVDAGLVIGAVTVWLALPRRMRRAR